MLIPAAGYPEPTRAKVVVWGFFAARPFGGMTWQGLHYLSGLGRLGCDVWYVEDSDNEVFAVDNWWPTVEYGANAEFVNYYMNLLGLGDHWVFRPRSESDVCYGALSLDGLRQLSRDADIVLNVCGSHMMRPEHEVIRQLVYLETDPVLNQLRVADGDESMVDHLNRFTHHFTYGENFGSPDCTVPLGGYRWLPTRPPVCVDWWHGAAGRNAGQKITTVANWRNTGKDFIWRGETFYWRKDLQYRSVIDMPAVLPWQLELALVGANEDDLDHLHTHGWKTLSATTLSDPMSYREYIRSSAAEFSVAKEQYVKPRSGWFSDRSVCYLAAGLPVVLQDTGFSTVIPTGAGLFAFSTKEDARNALEEIISDYERHSKAAAEIAREYFDAQKVIGDMLERIESS